MKILIPYNVPFKLHTNSKGKVIPGGGEKFAFDIFDNFDSAIPLEITNDIILKRQTKKVMRDAITKHNPDMILLNRPVQWGRMMLSFKIPLICIVHEGLSRHPRMIGFGDLLKDLNDNGTHMYFVSEHQYNYYKALAKRIRNVDFGSIKGYVNPSYLPDDTPFNEESIWDVSTVGRNEPLKDPFVIKKKLKKSNLVSLVMTNDATYKKVNKDDSFNNYVKRNQHWDYVMRGTAHKQVIDNISKSKVFVSTWPKESFGITTMEALGCGVPTILFTDRSNNHASESIAVDPSHVLKMNKTCSADTFIEGINVLYNRTKQIRKDIREQTIIKHSFSNWKKRIEDIINMRFDDKIKYNTVEEFI